MNKARPVMSSELKNEPKNEPKGDSTRIMTVPDEITEDEFVTATGNDFVSLPEIDAWGRVLSATFLHGGCAGLIEVRGISGADVDRGAPPPEPALANQRVSARVPLLAPMFVWDGAPVDLAGSAPPEFSLEEDWIPTFSWTAGRPSSGWASDGGAGRDAPEDATGDHGRVGGLGTPEWRLRARIVAPLDEKGFCYVLELQRFAREEGEALGGAAKKAVPGAEGAEGRGAKDGPLRETTVQAELGVRLTWGYTGIRVFTSREFPVVCGCRYDRWTHSVVAEALGPLPVFAFALNASGDFDHLEMTGPGCDAATCGQDRDGTAGITVRASKHVTLAPGEGVTVAFYVAFNREADGARTTSVHLRRQGWEALDAETRRWLADHRVSVPGKRGGREESVLNRNLLFCRFFATGKTLDSEEVVAITSRSPRYYVSAAFWARDVLLWALPGLVLIDRVRAREVLLYSLSVGTMHVGDHAQYMDGRSLYPGFELDEAAAFLVGLGTYLERTCDFQVIEAPQVLEGIRRVLAEIDKWTLRAGDGTPVLCKTFLDPSDDQVRFPFLTYDNVLVRKAWQVAADALDRLAENGAHAGHGSGPCASPGSVPAPDAGRVASGDGIDGDGGPSSRDQCAREKFKEEACRLRDAAEAIGEAIRRYCVVDGPFGPMYAWSIGLARGSCPDTGPGVEPATLRDKGGAAGDDIGCRDTRAVLQGGAQEDGADAEDDGERNGEREELRRTGVELYDNPPGSLELVGYYGYRPDEDGAVILANTRRWIRSRHNPYFIEGRFTAPCSAHSLHPWPMAAANSILAEVSAYDGTGLCDVGAVKDAVELLTSAPMDFGFACESINEETGTAKTGAAFASAAGFLAYSLWRGLHVLG
ncbi:MAG: glycoside hydrolase family 125 protein [Betaproteobacteria bacterium]